jgi:hypothetical protein
MATQRLVPELRILLRASHRHALISMSATLFEIGSENRGGGTQICPHGGEGAMKILRAVKRRGASVDPAGYFNVLKAHTWSAASRLPNSPYLIGQFKTTQEPGSQGTTIVPEILKVDRHDSHSIRATVIVVAATAITWALLLWVMHP